MYTVSILRNRLYVNNNIIEDISSNRYRLVGRMDNGLIVKADYLPSVESSLHIQTKAELDLYPFIHLKDLKYFPVIVDQGTHRKNKFAWVIEKPIVFVPHKRRPSPKMGRILRRLISKYGIYDVDPSFVADESNWGVTKYGVPVIFDFGSNKYSTGEWNTN